MTINHNPQQPVLRNLDQSHTKAVGPSLDVCGDVDGPITLLEIALELIENAWLLIAAVILPAVLMYAFHEVFPSYTSRAVLELTAEDAAIAEAYLHSPAAVQLVLGKVTDLQGATPEARARNLEAMFTISPAGGKFRAKSNLVYLEVRDSKPERAQFIAQSLIDAWVALSKPRIEAEERLKMELGRVQESLQAVQSAIKGIEGAQGAAAGVSTGSGEVLGALYRERQALMKSIQEGTAELRGVSRDVVISAPSRPIEPNHHRSRGRSAAVYGLVGGAAAIAFLLARLVLGRIRRDPLLGRRLHAIRWFPGQRSRT